MSTKQAEKGKKGAKSSVGLWVLSGVVICASVVAGFVLTDVWTVPGVTETGPVPVSAGQQDGAGAMAAVPKDILDRRAVEEMRADIADLEKQIAALRDEMPEVMIRIQKAKDGTKGNSADLDAARTELTEAQETLHEALNNHPVIAVLNAEAEALKARRVEISGKQAEVLIEIRDARKERTAGYHKQTTKLADDIFAERKKMLEEADVRSVDSLPAEAKERLAERQRAYLAALRKAREELVQQDTTLSKEEQDLQKTFVELGQAYEDNEARIAAMGKKIPAERQRLKREDSEIAKLALRVAELNQALGRSLSETPAVQALWGELETLRVQRRVLEDQVKLLKARLGDMEAGLAAETAVREG